MGNTYVYIIPAIQDTVSPHGNLDAMSTNPLPKMCQSNFKERQINQSGLSFHALIS